MWVGYCLLFENTLLLYKSIDVVLIKEDNAESFPLKSCYEIYCIKFK